MKQSFIILYFLKDIVQVISKARLEQIQHSRDQHYFISAQNSLIFESDTGVESEISSIDYKFIEDPFTISAFDQGKIIHLAFLSSLQFWKTTNFCVCQLLQKELLNFISCIDGIYISQQNYTLLHLQNGKKYKIILSQRTLELCSEIFVGNENQILVCCFVKEVLKIYVLDLKLQSTKIWVDESEQKLVDCSKKVLNSEDRSFLVFYKCKNWKVIDLAKNQITIILNKEIGGVNFPILNEIQNLSEIFICYNQLYLVEDAKYYTFAILEKSFEFLYNNLTTMNIKKIVFSQYCIIKFIILQSKVQVVPILQFNSDKKEVIINQDSEVYEINSFLLIKNEEEINLVLCQILNQTYKVHSSKLQFISNKLKIGNLSIQTPNLFFQIDESTNKAFIYKYNYLPKFIKPTKNFVFEIFQFNIFTNIDDDITIKNFVYSGNSTQTLSHNIILENKCQLFPSIQLKKEELGFPLALQLQFQTETIIRSIDDEQDFYSYLPFSITKEEIAKILWIDVSNTKIRNLVVYLTQTQLQTTYLNNPVEVYQESLKYQQVFNFQNHIVLLNFKFKQLKRKLIGLSYIHENVYFFEENIVYAFKCLDFLIIQFADETYCIFYVYGFKMIYLGQEYKEFGVPLCYYSRSTYSLIQFEKVFVCKINNTHNIFPIENIEIFHISLQSSGFLVSAIHKDFDKIVMYNIDENSIIQLKEFIFLESTLFRPLIYQYIIDFISIASITNNNKSILTIKTKNIISIVSIKYCSNFNFTLQNGILIYSNENQVFQVQSLQHYNLKINIIPFQKSYFSNQKVSIQAKFQESNLIYFQQKTLNIITRNHCKQIMRKKNILYLEGDSEIILSNIFDGQIQKITSSDENLLVIDGPFHSQIKIGNCGNSFTTNNYCFFVYNKTIKSTFHYFNLKCIPQLEYCLIKDLGKDKISIVFNFISNSKILIFLKRESNYFFHLFQIDHEKNLVYEISFQQILELNNLNEQQIELNHNMIFFNIVEKEDMKRYFLNFYENQYQVNIVEEKILHICSIQNNNNLYLFLQFTSTKFSKIFIECTLISFANKQKQIISQFIFGDEFFDFMIENNLHYHSLQQCSINILFFKASSLQVSFNILFISDEIHKDSLSSEIQIDYNCQSKIIQFKVIRVYRNPMHQLLNLYYRDSTYMILKSTKNLYFYNFTTNLPFYDYFCLIENESFRLQKVNTTHYLYNNYSLWYLTEIGFQIKVQENLTTKQEKIFLIAQNEISKAEIEIVFTEKQKQSEKILFNFVIKLLLLSFGIFLIFLVKRHLIKKQQVKIDQNIQQYQDQ